MHSNGTAVRGRQEAGPVSPVISGEDGWLGDDDRDQPLVLQFRLPVSADELTAALYDDDDQLCPADLTTEENVWGFAAHAIARDGMTAIERRADEIAVAETRETLANPAWLATCRRRVAEVTGIAPGNPDAHGAVSGLARMRALTEIASPRHASAQA
jgi:hypothetical protein